MSDARSSLEEVFRREHGVVLASLVKAFRDFDLAEDALADATTVALETWPRSGVPTNPAAWLTTVARRKAVDRLRRNRALASTLDELAQLPDDSELDDDGGVPDERLRLIFGCCHPALSPEARVALTLKSLGGLTTAEIARAFLTTEPTMFQRITRAKRKIRLAGIPIEVPSVEELPERLDAVLAVIYLIFNEGHTAGSGDQLVRVDLCHEAIRLAEMLTDLMPDQPEVWGLAALCWLIMARKDARIDSDGALVLLEDQDRSRWDRVAIARGVDRLRRGQGSGGGGQYLIQAEIAAAHSTAASWAATDWDRIIDAYRRLLAIKPSPVVFLNMAAAVAMRDGPETGLALIEQLGDSLDGYPSFHVARSELLFRAGRLADARAGFERSLELVGNNVERRHIESRIAAAASKESS